MNRRTFLHKLGATAVGVAFAQGSITRAWADDGSTALRGANRSVGERAAIDQTSQLAMMQAECLSIGQKYAALGGENGFLGRPTGDERQTRERTGRYRHYKNGSIFSSPQTCAHEVHGEIRAKWETLEWERGFGFPLTDELPTPDGIGRYNHFERGSIYYTPTTGAHEVHGEILGLWASLGWEQGFLGYPVTDELVMPGGIRRVSQFEHGSIVWHPDTGAMASTDKPVARLQLWNIECSFTEDLSTHDEAYLLVNGKRVWEKDMRQGQVSWLTHIPAFPFFDRIDIQLKETDWPDPDDTLGHHQVSAEEADGQEKPAWFRQDEAWYQLRYRVLR